MKKVALFSLLLFGISFFGVSQESDVGSSFTDYYASRIDTVGTIPVRVFDFNVPESSLYLDVWMRPVIQDDTILPYIFILNGQYLNPITHKESGWHSLKEPILVDLKKGQSNRLEIVSPVDFLIPDIDFIRLSSTKSGAVLSPLSYESYAASTEDGSCSDTYTLSGIGVTETLMPTLPCKYSFYKLVRINSDLTGFSLSSTSTIPHIMDVFFCGKSTSGDVTAYGTYDNTITRSLHWSFVARVSADGKYKISEALNNTSFPHGTYMIKVRSMNNFEKGTASIKINNTSYPDEPIYYSAYRSKLSPSTPCVHYARATTSGVNPMVFVEGGGAQVTGRIVGFNDDVTDVSLKTTLGLSATDALFAGQMDMSTFGIHICSFSSFNPEGQCQIYSGPATGAQIPGRLNSPSHASTNLPIFDASAEVSVYDLQGVLLAKITPQKRISAQKLRECVNLPAGTYIIGVREGTETITYKILIP